MNYNDLMKKYRPGQTAEQPAAEPPVTEPVVLQPEPVVEQPRKPVRRPAAPTVTQPEPAPRPAKQPTPKPVGTQVGMFEEDWTPPASVRQEKPVSVGRRKPMRSKVTPDVLRSLPWLDIVMCLLTLIGVICVIANFNSITLALAYGISRIIRFLCGALLVAAIIVGLVLIFRSRRRYW